MVQGKVSSPTPVFCPGPPCLSLKQYEMVATCAGLGDSQLKPSYESRLVASGAGPGATKQEVQELGGSLRPAVAYLRGFRKF